MRDRRRACGERQGAVAVAGAGAVAGAVAGVVHVNGRVVGEREGGRPPVRLGIAVRVARALGLGVVVDERGSR